MLEKTLESPLDCKETQPVHPKGNQSWKDWCWGWNSNTLAASCKELTHWKRHWCWEGLGAGGEGDDQGWEGWMASLTRWIRVWVKSGSCWWTGRPGMLWFMGLQRVGHDWATELNWKYKMKDKVIILYLLFMVTVTGLLMVIISQCIQILNPYVAHLKLMLYVNHTLIKIHL